MLSNCKKKKTMLVAKKKNEKTTYLALETLSGPYRGSSSSFVVTVKSGTLLLSVIPANAAAVPALVVEG
jgi:hypothetical protein